MKGIEIGPNLLVIIAILLITMIALVVLFLSQTSRGAAILDLQAEHSRACNLFVSTGGCNPSGNPDMFEIEISGEKKTLTELCNEMGITSSNDCKESCGCIVR